jgi:hypothetical protein
MVIKNPRGASGLQLLQGTTRLIDMKLAMAAAVIALGRVPSHELDSCHSKARQGKPSRGLRHLPSTVEVGTAGREEVIKPKKNTRRLTMSYSAAVRQVLKKLI